MLRWVIKALPRGRLSIHSDPSMRSLAGSRSGTLATMKPGSIALGSLALAAALTAHAAGCAAGNGFGTGGNGSNGSAGGSAGGNGGADAGKMSPVFAIYTVPASLDALSGETFFDHPWPSDLRLEKGSPRFTGYYNPLGLPILKVYIDTLNGLLDGFSPAGAGYLRFTGAIDTHSLPVTPKAAIGSRRRRAAPRHRPEPLPSTGTASSSPSPST